MGRLMGVHLPPSALDGMCTVQVGRSPNTEEGTASQTGRLLMQRGPDWPLLAPSLSHPLLMLSLTFTQNQRTSTLTQKEKKHTVAYKATASSRHFNVCLFHMQNRCSVVELRVVETPASVFVVTWESGCARICV